MKTIISIAFIISCINFGVAQIDSVSIKFEAELEFTADFLQLKSSIASRIDARKNGYLYSANLSFGLGVYDISNPTEINEVLDLNVSMFQDLSVSTLQQVDNFLFVGLGDFQSENVASGLAILDISSPDAPVLRDVWVSENYVNGVSHLDIYNGIVYLSMMNDGLLILDATDVNDVQYVNQIVPDLTFGGLESEHYQGRGLTKKGSILYFTFDRGGLRAIDVSDIYNPVEVGQYINQALIDKATAAYNDVLIIGDYAYVSVDYCGLEVIDISTTPWTLIEWYDPVECEGLNWFGAEIHTNELVTACNDSLLFVSGGNSEVVVFDISVPSELNRISGFFELDNELAAYGLHVLDDNISVSYINNPFNIPYVGNWGGLKMLTFSKSNATSLDDIDVDSNLILFPNPTTGILNIKTFENIEQVDIYSLYGTFVKSVDSSEIKARQINVGFLEEGSYLLKCQSKSGSFTSHFVKH